MQKHDDIGWPYFAPDEVAAVQEVLLSGKVNYWTGEKGRRFEDEFAATFGCKYGIALANGTAALELALKSIGIGPGDEVIVTSYSFIASASAIVLQGAPPVFADVDESLTIDPEIIQSKMTKRTRAIIAVHLLGYPCDMDAINKLALQNGLKVVEDCAQAHGAYYKGRPIGSLGDVSAFSFCQDKIMTTGGEGGMLITNNEVIWQKAWSYKDHGKSQKAMDGAKETNRFSWVHESFGTNWRMTEMQAAIGLVQLRKLPSWVTARRENAELIDQAFDDAKGFVRPDFSTDRRHAFYRYLVLIDQNCLKKKWSRDRIVDELNAQGLLCGSGICPEIYLEPAFKNSKYHRNIRLPVAKSCGERSIQFPVHPTLSREFQQYRVQVVSDLLREAYNEQEC
mgnify:CR=1 FL=1